MKYSILVLSLISAISFADTFTNPLPSSVKAIDNGGTKQAIDAYKDGIGAELIDKPGVATDNSAMNILTIKYGEVAKANNNNIVDQVLATTSAPSLDVQLANSILNNTNSGLISTVGEVLYSKVGSYNWTVPAGVYNVSVVAVGGGGSRSNGNNCGGGGGGLGWKNNIAVNPGQIIPIVVGNSIVDATCGVAGCGNTGGNSYFSGLTVVAGKGGAAGCGVVTGTSTGGTFIGDGGGFGGSGSGSYGNGHAAGSGGAGGYSGNGGNGTDNATIIAGTGGSGAGMSNSGAGGGGVGIYGQGVTGATAGAPGSGGVGSKFGGGGGGIGAVRIIFGPNRLFPITNVNLASSNGNVTNY